ncbi:MAG: hypothetical protein JWM21_447 [Acidobacteria bacterium]|nr:hypothetical protein [Acidobacteriota bacterium]
MKRRRRKGREMVELLKSIPVAFYAAVLGSLIALTSSYLTNRSNTRRLKLQFELDRETKEREFTRDKVEELYLLHEEWLNVSASSNLPFISVMKGEITYNDALDMFIDGNKNRTVDFKRLQMLVDLYFPDVKASFDRLATARDEVNKIKSEHKRQYKRGNIDGTAYVMPFIEAQQTLEGEASHVKEQIIQQSTRFKSPVRQRR